MTATIETPPSAMTHDYTDPGWGHHASVLAVHDEGMRLSLYGHGPLPRAGDFLLMPNEGATTRYRVLSAKYPGNPPDMWFAEAEFAPRQEADRG